MILGSTFSAGSGQINGLVISPLPEPTTLTLLTAAATLTLIRRRKHA